METLGSFRDTARPSAWGSFPLGEIPGIRRAFACARFMPATLHQGANPLDF